MSTTSKESIAGHGLSIKYVKSTSTVSQISHGDNSRRMAGLHSANLQTHGEIQMGDKQEIASATAVLAVQFSQSVLHTLPEAA